MNYLNNNNNASVTSETESYALIMLRAFDGVTKETTLKKKPQFIKCNTGLSKPVDQ